MKWRNLQTTNMNNNRLGSNYQYTQPHGHMKKQKKEAEWKLETIMEMEIGYTPKMQL